MKKLVSLLLLLANLNSIACVGDICVGDLVIPEGKNPLYKVLSIHSKTKIVTTQETQSGGIAQLPTEKIAITFGCLEKFCIGQEVMLDEKDQFDKPEKNSGKIVGINFYKKTLTIRKSRGYNVVYPTYLVAHERGCMKGICVGDMVKRPSWLAHKYFVKAINPAKKLFSVLINNDYSLKIEDVYFEQLYLDQESKEYNKKNSMPCLGDICVGDVVIPNSFWNGHNDRPSAKVLSFHPRTKIVTTQETLSGKVESFPAGEISVKFGCLGKFCVGHKVLLDQVDKKGQGEIVAINYYRKVLTIQNEDKSYVVLPAFAFAIQRGCMKGICVGDMVKLTHPTSAKYFVKAISPEKNLFLILVNNDPYWTHDEQYFQELVVDKECKEFNQKMRQ